MRNIGPVSRQWLWQIGVRHLQTLREVGAVRAYLMIKAAQPRATLNLLWGLEAAVRDIDWRALTNEDKRQLKSELPLHK